MHVKVAEIRKRFTGAQTLALDGISFTAEAHSITSLVGASGCGKTTTLRCIAGLEHPEAGEIRFGERIMSSGGRAIVPTAERNLGMVFQSYALWPHLTVSENIAFGLRARKWKTARIHERIREVLELVDLPGYEARYPSQLSGGQQQRVAVGRSLAYEPAVLLMDEPLANLDAHLRGQMRQAIRRLQRQTKVTMIYVTHDRAEAMELSDTIVILDKGRIVQMGTPDTLFANPANALVARFLGHSNLLPVSIARKLGDETEVATAFGKMKIHGFEGTASEASLLVQSDALHLASAGGAVPEGWLEGRGKVLTASRGSTGILCALETTGGNLDVHFSGKETPPLDSEIHFHIDPSRCKLLPVHVDDDR